MNSKVLATSLGSTGSTRTPLWLWPNLLSLDAPLIAALWQDAFAIDAGVELSIGSRIALPAAVWLIYLIDRLLDTAGTNSHKTARHRFYRVNRGLCCALAALAACVLLASLPLLPHAVLKNGLTTAGIVALYLLIVHLLSAEGSDASRRRWFPKELVVGLVFAVGTLLAPATRSTDPKLLIFPGLIFGVLLWVNTSAIEVWESGRVDRASAWAVSHFAKIAMAACTLCLPLAFWPGMQHGALALSVSSLGFWGIAREYTPQLDTDALRALVDVPLLAPLLIIGLR